MSSGMSRLAPDRHRLIHRKVPRVCPGEDAVAGDIVALASWRGRCGYRRITAALRGADWVLNARQVERFFRREVPKAHRMQPRKVAFGPQADRRPVRGLLVSSTFAGLIQIKATCR